MQQVPASQIKGMDSGNIHVLRENESYWGKAATAETIDIKIIAEDSARAMMLRPVMQMLQLIFQVF